MTAVLGLRMRRWRWWKALTAGAFVLAVAAAVVAPSYRSEAQVTPVTVTRDGLINYLKSISGNRLVSGIHTPPDQPGAWFQKIHDMTGVYPGMWASDFHYEAAKIAARQSMIDHAKSEWANGSLVELSFHACSPIVAEPCNWNGVKADPTDAQWAELLTDGTPLNSVWKARLDGIVPYLQQLKDAGIPVLWRPLHEINAPWSWWGGRPGPEGSRKLFQITHDYLTNVKGLNNLVWVWNPGDLPGGAATIGDYWPGDQYVDVAALDVWFNHQPPLAYYHAMLDLAGNKPIAMGENGTSPTPATMQEQPCWAWFLLWQVFSVDPTWNTPAGIQTTFSDRHVLNQGEPHLTPAQSSATNAVSCPAAQ